MFDRLRGLLIGGPQNLFDPRVHHSMALIAFAAWVGLGSDGLSSSSYGPEEAFLQLAEHRHLALYLVLATIGTVFLISTAYSQVIELFPTGGGGYLVATKLLGRTPGIISGCALVVDYVLDLAEHVDQAGRLRVSAAARTERHFAAGVALLGVEEAAVLMLLSRLGRERSLTADLARSVRSLRAAA